MDNPGSIVLAQQKSLKKRVTVALLSVIGIYSFVYLQVDPITPLLTLPNVFLFFGENFFPPNFNGFSSYISLIVQTLLFAVVGTYISAVLSFVFGLLMAESINPIAPVRIAIRFIVSFIRNIPILVWASLLVYIFGIGNMVGLIALILATFGFLTRSYAEEMNNIADSKLEALKATGATPAQLLVHGIIPAFFPAWINWTFFSFEINIRASSILGMVGAGGIGIMIQTNIRLFKYQEAMALIIILVILVLVTEFCVNKLRKWIL